MNWARDSYNHVSKQITESVNDGSWAEKILESFSTLRHPSVLKTWWKASNPWLRGLLVHWATGLGSNPIKHVCFLISEVNIGRSRIKVAGWFFNEAGSRFKSLSSKDTECKDSVSSLLAQKKPWRWVYTVFKQHRFEPGSFGSLLQCLTTCATNTTTPSYSPNPRTYTLQMAQLGYIFLTTLSRSRDSNPC